MPMVEAAAVEEVAAKQTKQCGNYSASEDPVISASILTSHHMMMMMMIMMMVMVR